MSQMVTDMADYHNADLSAQKILHICEDLEGYTLEEIHQSWRKFRKTEKGRFMPSVFDLISNIDDGRPTAQKAFAMLPQAEEQTVVWTAEMAAAWRISRQHPKGSSLAYSAFKDEYDSLVLEARKVQQKPRWSVSAGTDGGSRDAVLSEAVNAKRISLDYARQFSPELGAPRSQQLQIGSVDVQKLIAQTKTITQETDDDGS